MYNSNIPNMKTNVNQFIVLVENYGKEVRILDFLKLIRPRDLTLIYCESAARAKDLKTALTARDLATELILEDTSIRDKNCSIARLSTGASQIIVTECGRLFGPYPINIKYVVNYDFPQDLMIYVERVNACVPAGAVLTFFSERNERMAKDLMKILQKIEYEVPDELIHLAKQYEKKELIIRNNNNNYNNSCIISAPVCASFERPTPLCIDTRIPIGMRYNIDAFIQRQKLRSTIAPPFFRPLAILPPAIELIERIETPRELNAPPDKNASAGSVSNP